MVAKTIPMPPNQEGGRISDEVMELASAIAKHYPPPLPPLWRTRLKCMTTLTSDQMIQRRVEISGQLKTLE